MVTTKTCIDGKPHGNVAGKCPRCNNEVVANVVYEISPEEIERCAGEVYVNGKRIK